MKKLIIGPSLIGKTTIVRELRSRDLQGIEVSEIDEELVLENGGEFPMDHQHKLNTVFPQVKSKVFNKESIIFLSNTDYFSPEDIITAKRLGFEIIMLMAPLEELIKRNSQRVKDQGYADMSEWLPGMIDYQTKIINSDLVDIIIDATQRTAIITNVILKAR